MKFNSKNINGEIHLTWNIGDDAVYKQKNYEDSQKQTFIIEVTNYLEKQLKKGNLTVEIGDFYNYDYLLKWIMITDHFKNNENIKFVTHFKAIDILEQYLAKYQVDYRNINVKFIFISDDATQEQIDYVNWLGLEVQI